MNSSVAVPRDSNSSRASIVTHPWFAKVIGLWFAALFGLCSLAVGSDVLENAVTVLGIDRIVPAAAPPLGQTARLLLAMVMAGVGEIVGLLIGARLAASRRAPPQRQRQTRSAAQTDSQTAPASPARVKDRHADAPPRKPLSAVDDLGGIDTTLRRRALVGEATLEPHPFFDPAPLPGDDLPGDEEPPAVARLSETEIFAVADQPRVDEAPQSAVAIATLDLATYPAPIEQQAMVPAAPFAASFAAPFPAPFAAPVAATSEPEAATATATPAAVPFTLPPASIPAAAIASTSLDTLGAVQLSERLALALRARRERLAPQAPQAPQATTTAEVTAVAVPPVEHPTPAAGDAPVAAPDPGLAFAPTPVGAIARLPGLFPTLTEPSDDTEVQQDFPALARTLARTLSAMPVTPVPSEDLDDEPGDFSPQLARGLEILARRAAKPGSETQTPPNDAWSGQAVSPACAASDGADAAPSAAADQTASYAIGSEEGDDPDESAQSSYSSLLEMGSGFQRSEAVRIEEPQSDSIEPVVIFPGQATRMGGQAPAPFAAPFEQPATHRGTGSPLSASGGSAAQADPEETDRALRAALASLQRISGAR